MEKGTVRSFDKNTGMGMIGRAADMDVTFYADSIIAKDRSRLTSGDAVWFEVDNMKNLLVAINIRKA